MTQFLILPTRTVMFSSPLWIDEGSKSRLEAAIWNDTLFLSQLGVMDYSLLTGIHQQSAQFVVGIIGKRHFLLALLTVL